MRQPTRSHAFIQPVPILTPGTHLHSNFPSLFLPHSLPTILSPLHCLFLNLVARSLPAPTRTTNHTYRMPPSKSVLRERGYTPDYYLQNRDEVQACHYRPAPPSFPEPLYNFGIFGKRIEGNEPQLDHRIFPNWAEWAQGRTIDHILSLRGMCHRRVKRVQQLINRRKGTAYHDQYIPHLCHVPNTELSRQVGSCLL